MTDEKIASLWWRELVITETKLNTFLYINRKKQQTDSFTCIFKHNSSKNKNNNNKLKDNYMRIRGRGDFEAREEDYWTQIKSKDLISFLLQDQSNNWAWRWIGEVRKKVNCTWAVSVLLDEAAMVLSSWGRMNRDPTVLTVVAEAVDVTAKEWSKLSITINTTTLITYLIIKDIWFDFNLWQET